MTDAELIEIGRRAVEAADNMKAFPRPRLPDPSKDYYSQAVHDGIRLTLEQIGALP